jgi:hypothetical protein
MTEEMTFHIYGLTADEATPYHGNKSNQQAT